MTNLATNPRTTTTIHSPSFGITESNTCDVEAVDGNNILSATDHTTFTVMGKPVPLTLPNQTKAQRLVVAKNAVRGIHASHSTSNSIISIGEFLSGACALHCTAYLVLTAVLSFGLLGSHSLSDKLEWLEGTWWHIGFGSSAALFALLTRRSLINHGSLSKVYDVVVFCGLSLMLLSVGIEVFGGDLHSAHQMTGHKHDHHDSHSSLLLIAHILFISGNALIIGGHYWARKLIKGCRGQCLRRPTAAA